MPLTTCSINISLESAAEIGLENSDIRIKLHKYIRIGINREFHLKANKFHMQISFISHVNFPH